MSNAHPCPHQCLGRIGKDLFIEADEEQFMLRALNDAKSAFSAFTFRRVGLDEARRDVCLAYGSPPLSP